MKIFLLTAVFFILSCNVATAHPHVFVDCTVTLVFDKEKLVAVSQQWKFGELFSSTLLEDFDVDKNGQFTGDEIKELKDGAFDNLKEYGYFNHIRVNGEKVKTAEAKDFLPSVTKNEEVFYDFTVKLIEPIDYTKSLVTIGIYDPDYYIDVIYTMNKTVVLKGLPENKCSYKIIEDKEHPVYMGMVFPKIIRLECKK